MSITRKLFAITLGLVAFFVLANFWIQNQVVLETFNEIERNLASKNADVVEEALKEQILDVDRSTYDWSAWDDTYYYASGSNEGYVASNLSPDSFTNLSLDLALFFDTEMKLIWGRIYDHDNEDQIETVLTESGSPLVRAFKQNLAKIDLSLIDDEQVSKGIRVIDGLPMIFSARPILLSNGDGPHQGFVVFARFIDSKYIAALRSRLKTNFKLISAEGVTNEELIAKPYTVHQLDDKTLEVSKVFYSDQSPVLEIVSQFRRDITHTGKTSISYSLLLFCLVSLGGFAIIWLLITRNYLLPIAKLVAQMKAISMNKDYSLRSGLHRNDEIGMLAKDFDHMLDIIESNDRELHEANSRINRDHEKLKKVGQDLQAANTQLEILSNTDPLTGLANRLCFDQKLANEWKRLERSGEPLAILMIDIDFFKNYNDYYGHLAGDVCLKRVSQAIKRCLGRPDDLAARYGGEEFIVILPQAETEGARIIANKILETIQTENIEHQSNAVAPCITISIGVASAKPSQGQNAEELISLADSALYLAKKNGRNRVEVAISAEN